MMDIFELPAKTIEERKEKVSNVVKHSELFNRDITTTEIIQKIVHYLTLKALIERKEHNEKYKTAIGNAAFWFNNIKDANGIVLRSELGSSLYPNEWNFDKILTFLEEKEKNFYIETGADISGVDYPMINQTSNIT